MTARDLIPPEMIPVDRNTFFETVGAMNVHPEIYERPWDRYEGYIQLWILQNSNRRALGASYGGTALAQSVFFVLPEFAEAAR